MDFALHFHRPLQFVWSCCWCWVTLYENRGVSCWNQAGLGWESCMSEALLLLLRIGARRSHLRTGLRDSSAMPLRAGCLLTLNCASQPCSSPYSLAELFLFPTSFLHSVEKCRSKAAGCRSALQCLCSVTAGSDRHLRHANIPPSGKLTNDSLLARSDHLSMVANKVLLAPSHTTHGALT